MVNGGGPHGHGTEKPAKKKPGGKGGGAKPASKAAKLTSPKPPKKP